MRTNTLNQLDKSLLLWIRQTSQRKRVFQDFNIEFRHVDFTYNNNFVLKDFSLNIVIQIKLSRWWGFPGEENLPLQS